MVLNAFLCVNSCINCNKNLKIPNFDPGLFINVIFFCYMYLLDCSYIITLAQDTSGPCIIAAC